MNTRYYIIAGEASGDLHGSNLVNAIKQLDADARFRGFGGDKMQAKGVEIIKHIRDLAFMGFVEVLSNIRTISKNLDQCKSDIKNYKPDAVILIDYPGFNLRIAEYVKSLGIKVIYYISPQVWAWKQSRVKKIKKCVDHMLVILPFEKDFYKRFDYDVDFVGHPLLDAVPMIDEKELNTGAYISLLPGSRKQEIKSMLPVMDKVASSFPNETFVVVAAPSIEKEFYDTYLHAKNIELTTSSTYEVMKNAKAALVTSGTATLETALLNVPQVVCYKGGALSYIIAKKLIKVKYISLVNLILNEPLLVELIQSDLNEVKLAKELDKIVHDDKIREILLKGYVRLRETLGGKGASERSAELIVKYVKG